MRDETVARNYAETLLEVAERHEGLEPFGEGIEVVARLIEENSGFRTFLETPRIAATDKKKVLRTAFGEQLPVTLLNFLFVLIDRRRQRLLREIASEYHTLVDERMNRERVDVTVAHTLDDPTVTLLEERLTGLLGRQAIARMRVKPRILGGVVVRAGDTIYDGSLRRRLDDMRRSLLTTNLVGGVET